MRYVIVFVLISCVLTGCGTYSREPLPGGSVNREVSYTFPVKSSPDSLTAEEQQDIEHLFAGIPQTAAKMATIEASSITWANSVKVGTVKTLLHGLGIDPKAVHVALIDHEYPLRLHVEYRTFPYAEKCPNWEYAGLFNQESNLSSHLGCSTLRNHMLMMEDPTDLVRGKSNPHAETESAVRAIQTYYGGPASGTTSSSSASGGTTSGGGASATTGSN